MARRSNYEIIEDQPGKPLVIRDLGPWHLFLSVTNDAENVVAELFMKGKLYGSRRLFYFDSDGIKDEIVQHDGHFLGFAPGPRP